VDFVGATILSRLSLVIARTATKGKNMIATIEPHELMRLILKAETAYETRGTSAIAQRMRIQAMKRFVTYMKAQAPNKSLQISLEDHLILTDLPE
jgi:hypothetical protein